MSLGNRERQIFKRLVMAHHTHLVAWYHPFKLQILSSLCEHLKSWMLFHCILSKPGKWGAMHVCIAWQIHRHKQRVEVSDWSEVIAQNGIIKWLHLYCQCVSVCFSSTTEVADETIRVSFCDWHGRGDTREQGLCPFLTSNSRWIQP